MGWFGTTGKRPLPQPLVSKAASSPSGKVGKPVACKSLVKKLLQFWFSHIKAEWASS